MSQLVQMLEKLALNTEKVTARDHEIDQLAESFALNEELTAAMRKADLAGLIQLAGMPGRGCFVIVAPDVPEQPDDEDEPDDDKKSASIKGFLL